MNQPDAADYAGLPVARSYVVEAAGDTYELLIDQDGRRAIRCKVCFIVSHHPEDVVQRYCGWCHAFHLHAGWPKGEA